MCGQRSAFRVLSLNTCGGDEPIEVTDIIKYLALHIGPHLTCNWHIDSVVSKVNQQSKLLWKMRSVIMRPLPKYLYQTLINPIFNYYDFIYDGCLVTNANRLQIAQNSCLRAIKQCKRDHSTGILHDELKIDYLSTSYRKSSLIMVYMGLNNLGPPNMNCLFESYNPPRLLWSEHEN